MTQLMELLLVYSNTPLDELNNLLEKELKKFITSHKEETNKKTRILVQLDKKNNVELLIEIGTHKKHKYILFQYPNSYEWKTEKDIITQRKKIHKIYKTLCKTTSPLIASAGITDYWPPFEKIMTEISQLKIPTQKNPDPKESEPEEYPIYSEIGLFLGKEYLQKYKIEKDKLAPLKPQTTKNGMFIDIEKNRGVYITEPDKKEDKEKYQAWEYLRKKLTEKQPDNT